MTESINTEAIAREQAARSQVAAMEAERGPIDARFASDDPKTAEYFGTPSYHGASLDAAPTEIPERALEDGIPTTTIQDVSGNPNRAFLGGTKTVDGQEFTDLDVLKPDGDSYRATVANADLDKYREQRRAESARQQEMALPIGSIVTEGLQLLEPQLSQEDLNQAKGLPRDFHHARPRPQIPSGSQ